METLIFFFYFIERLHVLSMNLENPGPAHFIVFLAPNTPAPTNQFINIPSLSAGQWKLQDQGWEPVPRPMGS